MKFHLFETSIDRIKNVKSAKFRTEDHKTCFSLSFDMLSENFEYYVLNINHVRLKFL